MICSGDSPFTLPVTLVPTLHKDMRAFLAACEVCAQGKAQHQVPAGPLVSHCSELHHRPSFQGEHCHSDNSRLLFYSYILSGSVKISYHSQECQPSNRSCFATSQHPLWHNFWQESPIYFPNLEGFYQGSGSLCQLIFPLSPSVQWPNQTAWAGLLSSFTQLNLHLQTINPSDFCLKSGILIK